MTRMSDIPDRVMRNIHYFEDSGDVGDNRAYYPPYQNRTHISHGLSSTIWLEDDDDDTT